MDTWDKLQGVMSMTMPVTRRGFLKRAAAVGVAVPATASLLAACGGNNANNTVTAPSPTTGVMSTPTAGMVPTTGAAGGGSPTAPAGGASPTAGGPGASPTTGANTPAAGGGTPKQGGTLVVQGHQEVASLHPDEAGPQIHYVMIRMIHEPLVDLDYDYQITPILAQTYEAAADGTKYTFNLRKGVTFQDGVPFTSADVKYNIEWYKDPASAAVGATDFTEVGTVDTPDDTTVVVNMSTVNAAYLAGAATYTLFPKHIQEVTGKDNYTPKALGTGPYKLKEWQAASQTTLQVYEDYWDGRAWIDLYREEVVPEGSQRAIGLRTGKSDHATWPLQAEDNLKFIAEGKFGINRAPGLAVNHFPLNTQTPALSDKIVRQAMLTAINRDSLINDLEKGLAVKATANLSPAVVFYYNPDVKKYDYEPAAANKMLDDAGYAAAGDGIRAKNGQKLSFTCTVITGDQRRRPEAEVVQQNLKAIGIDMQIEEKPVASILEGLPKGDLQASLFNWTYGASEPDARGTLRSGAARNFSQYNNPRVDELLDQGVATIDPAARATIYKEIQAIIAEDVPFLYIMYWEDIQIWNKRVQGRPAAYNNPTFMYGNVHKLWIDDSQSSV